MDYTNPQYWPTLVDLAGRMDTLDYYQILNISHDSSSAQLKKSYYQLARALHPDKFFTIPDDGVKQAVHKIYKRITEAYTVLKDEAKRKKYNQGLSGDNREQYLRYNEELEQEHKKEKREAAKIAKTPQGEKSYQAAVVEIQKNNWDAAFRHVQSALLFEAGNEKLKQLLEEIKAKRGK
jgi:curved DNA-binding protein CbpA